MQDFKVMLYNGTVELLYNDEKHLYSVDGKKVDGTTGVLSVIAKPALMFWAVNQAIDHLSEILKPGVSYDEIQLKEMLDGAKTAHRKKKEQAADKGTLVHEWCENWIAGKNPKTPVNPELKNATDQFLKWTIDNDVKFLESERIIYSKKYGYAGTMDFLATVNGKMTVGDFKTSTAIYNEYWFQVAAYHQAYEEEFPDIYIGQETIVRIGKDASLEVKSNDNPEDFIKNREAFNAALVLHRRINEYKDREYREKNNGGIL